jgi:HEAT repeat protein
MIKNSIVLILALGLTLPCSASISKKKNSILSELQLPAKARVAKLKRRGKKGYRRLQKLAFDHKLPLKVRWKALASMAIIAKSESLPDLEKAVRSKDWFMRDAGLKAMRFASPNSARPWARRLIEDPSLIVRTSAVQTMKKLKDQKSIPLLWKSLYDKKNFRNTQSLWVRRHIVETLSLLESEKSLSRFIHILKDRDKSLHKPAVYALERLTRKRLGKKNEPIEHKRAYWLKWSKKQKTI